jgi:hypothetical protein
MDTSRAEGNRRRYLPASSARSHPWMRSRWRHVMNLNSLRLRRQVKNACPSPFTVPPERVRAIGTSITEVQKPAVADLCQERLCASPAGATAGRPSRLAALA